MCLSKRSELRHIDPKAQTERWDIFDSLSQLNSLKYKSSRREVSDMKKVLSADVLSPILAYMRLDAPHKMILESIPREKENAHFSIVDYRPVSEVKFEHGVLYYNDQIVEEDPLDLLNQGVTIIRCR